MDFQKTLLHKGVKSDRSVVNALQNGTAICPIVDGIDLIVNVLKYCAGQFNCSYCGSKLKPWDSRGIFGEAREMPLTNAT